MNFYIILFQLIITNNILSLNSIDENIEAKKNILNQNEINNSILINNDNNNINSIIIDNDTFYNKNKNIKIKTDNEYILNYKGGDLEPEWQWAKNISIVYTWVDGSDINFQYLKSKYNGGINNTNNRYRSADELKYSIRSLEKYMPWHQGIIYIVTCQQIPKWLNINNPRIKIIYHKDIFPQHVYPTFDSNIIELFFDKIPGISERFIYFNDDFFLNNFIHPCFFFTSREFYPKFFKANYALKFNNNRIKEIIKKNIIKDSHYSTCYYTYKIIKKYFDKNFKYSYLHHSGYPFYRDLLEPFRQLFNEELKIAYSDRFRNPYKIQTIYLYQVFLEYATKHSEFPLKFGGSGEANNFKGYVLPYNRTINKYSVEVITNENYIKYGAITDDYNKNEENFNFFSTHPNILFYNLNDDYSKDTSLYQFTQYMITRYPNPSCFEKKKFIELEKFIPPLFEKVDNFINSLKSEMSEKYNFSDHFNDLKVMLNKYKLNIIKEYLNNKKNLYKQNIKISNEEKEEIDFLVNYNGEELSNEWQWVKNISIVYYLEYSNKKNILHSLEINNLKYSLRSIEKYIPWFKGNIFIIFNNKFNITWLNNKNKNIKLININNLTSEINLNNNYSNFNIEMYLDKIPNLSERFIYLKSNHFFINYTHPRFFFNKKFYPKYNFKKALTEEELLLKKKDREFLNTYKLIMNIFDKNYVRTYRYFENAPFSLYRDLFEPVRQIYLKYYNDNNEILPIYLVSTYNIYGTNQDYPFFVSGYGEIRNSKLPSINPNRTINYYGFDITSFSIINKTMINDISINENICNNGGRLIKKIKESKNIFISIKINKNIICDNNYINTFMNDLFMEKSTFEN